MPAKSTSKSTSKNTTKSADAQVAIKRAVRAKPPTGINSRMALAKKAAAPAVVRTAKAATPAAADGKTAKKAGKGNSKLVRDSFTMPEADFAVIAVLKGRALGARRAAKKSELLRAGLRALAKLDAKSLVAALDQLEPVKAGRPKKGH